MKPVGSFICCFIVASSLLYISLPSSFAADGVRTCSVKEVLKGGMYVYLRCQEKGKDLWLATVAREFNVDEVVSFLDVPPMTNFYSKQLDRTFPEIILMDNFPPGGSKK